MLPYARNVFTAWQSHIRTVFAGAQCGAPRPTNQRRQDPQDSRQAATGTVPARQLAGGHIAHRRFPPAPAGRRHSRQPENVRVGGLRREQLLCRICVRVARRDDFTGSKGHGSAVPRIAAGQPRAKQRRLRGLRGPSRPGRVEKPAQPFENTGTPRIEDPPARGAGPDLPRRDGSQPHQGRSGTLPHELFMKFRGPKAHPNRPQKPTVCPLFSGLPRTCHLHKHRFKQLQLGRIGNRARSEFVAEFHRYRIVGIESRPLRQACSIGVAGSNEVRPI